jgi:hypothetical protein
MMRGHAADTSDQKVLRGSWAEPRFRPHRNHCAHCQRPQCPHPRFRHRRPHCRERDELGRERGMKGRPSTPMMP